MENESGLSDKGEERRKKTSGRTKEKQANKNDNKSNNSEQREVEQEKEREETKEIEGGEEAPPGEENAVDVPKEDKAIVEENGNDLGGGTKDDANDSDNNDVRGEAEEEQQEQQEDLGERLRDDEALDVGDSTPRVADDDEDGESVEISANNISSNNNMLSDEEASSSEKHARDTPDDFSELNESGTPAEAAIDDQAATAADDHRHRRPKQLEAKHLETNPDDYGNETPKAGVFSLGSGTGGGGEKKATPLKTKKSSTNNNNNKGKQQQLGGVRAIAALRSDEIEKEISQVRKQKEAEDKALLYQKSKKEKSEIPTRIPAPPSMPRVSKIPKQPRVAAIMKENGVENNNKAGSVGFVGWNDTNSESESDAIALVMTSTDDDDEGDSDKKKKGSLKNSIKRKKKKKKMKSPPPLPTGEEGGGGGEHSPFDPDRPHVGWWNIWREFTTPTSVNIQAQQIEQSAEQTFPPNPPKYVPPRKEKKSWRKEIKHMAKSIEPVRQNVTQLAAVAQVDRTSLSPAKNRPRPRLLPSLPPSSTNKFGLGSMTAREKDGILHADLYAQYINNLANGILDVHFVDGSLSEGNNKQPGNQMLQPSSFASSLFQQQQQQQVPSALRPHPPLPKDEHHHNNNNKPILRSSPSPSPRQQGVSYQSSRISWKSGGPPPRLKSKNVDEFDTDYLFSSSPSASALKYGQIVDISRERFETALKQAAASKKGGGGGGGVDKSNNNSNKKKDGIAGSDGYEPDYWWSGN